MTRALIVGCAACMWEDVRRAHELGKFDAFYCIKLAGVHWPQRFAHWVTLHPEWMDDMERQRRAAGRPGGYQIVAPPGTEVGMHAQKGNIARRVSYKWKADDPLGWRGSSGLYAVKVALDDGHARVVLAGVPMTPDGGHFVRGKAWGFGRCKDFLPAWHKAKPLFADRVRSLSGWTQEQLGAPNADWFNQTT